MMVLAGSVWFSSEMKALKDDCERFEVFPPGHIYSSKQGEHLHLPWEYICTAFEEKVIQRIKYNCTGVLMSTFLQVGYVDTTTHPGSRRLFQQSLLTHSLSDMHLRR